MDTAARSVGGDAGTETRGNAPAHALAGPCVVVSPDAGATASALAVRLGAELVRQPWDVERALARLRMHRDARARRAEAQEALALAGLLAGSDEVADDLLETERHRIAEDAGQPDPGPLLERLHTLAGAVVRAEHEVADAAEALLGAQAAADEARGRGADAVPQGAAFDRDAAVALAGRIRDATARVVAAQASLGPRPTLADDERRDVARYSERIRHAEQRVEALRRARPRAVLAAFGAGLAIAGLAMKAGGGPPALAAPALAVIAGALLAQRSVAQAQASLAAARRAGAALVARLLPDRRGEDPAEAWQSVIAAWEAAADVLRREEAQLLELQRAWTAVAGRLDPDRLDAQLGAAADLRAAEARAAAARAALDGARRAQDGALRDWREALAGAGVELRPPGEVGEVRSELERRRQRRSAALAAMAQVDEAARRRRARRRLAELLAGRSIDDLAAAADDVAGHDVPARPVVLVDPLATLPRDRWGRLRRALVEAGDLPCVLVTSEPEAATWGLPRLEG